MADGRVISITNLRYLFSEKKFMEKNLLPLYPEVQDTGQLRTNNGQGFIELDQIQYKQKDAEFMDIEERSETDNTLSFTIYKNFVCLRISKNIVKLIKSYSNEEFYLYVVLSSVFGNITPLCQASLFFSKSTNNNSDEVLDLVRDKRATIHKNDALRDISFENVGIPPNDCILVPDGDGEHNRLEGEFNASLMEFDEDLGDVHEHRQKYGERTFQDIIQSTVDLPPDEIPKQLRNMNKLQKKFKAISDKKNASFVVKHDLKASNRFWKGKLITFIDGGVSTLQGLPKFKPHFIRVGDFSVYPGKSDDGGKTPAKDRENYFVKSYKIHEIFSDVDIIEKDEDEDYVIDTVRRNEAARYLCEAHYAWMRSRGKVYDDIQDKWIESLQPEVILFHGPLEYKFDMVTQNAPHYIPGLNKEWLEKNGITEKKVKKCFGDAFGDSVEWNAPITIYGFILRELEKSKVPILGCVERTVSYNVIKCFAKEYMSRENAEKYIKTAKKYDLKDDKLFGFVLREREYLRPLNLQFQNHYADTVNLLNMPNRCSMEEYKPIIKAYPIISATILNCSYKKLPFRIDMFSKETKYSLEELISLVYHNSILLGEYLFPVGLDIVDKHVRIPACLSQTVDAAFATKLLINSTSKDEEISRETGEPNNGRYTKNVIRQLSGNGRGKFNRPDESKYEHGKRRR